MHKKLLAIAGLIGIGVAGRLLPHLPNATPITSIALAGSKYIGRVWAVVIPIAALCMSDIVLGFYNWRILLSVYISFALIGIMSTVAKRYPDTVPTGFFIPSASLIFFLITNFAVWIFSPWYEKSIWGLLYCYTLGLPFMTYMFLGDLVYTAAFLGVFRVTAAKKDLGTQDRVHKKLLLSS